ncbi:MAG: ABC transporter ATP-binding protein [Promethearchaeota archaeon]
MPQTNDILIELRQLSKKFGKFTAVDKVSLQIYRGECIGFLGPNGAGKSTTMKMVAHLLRPTEGEVLIWTNGHLEQLTAQNRDRLLDNTGFLIESPAFYKTSTPRQILTYFAKLKGYPRPEIKSRVESIVTMIGLRKWIDENIGTFSKGMKQKIGILSAIVHDPDIVILDEPHTGLDPSARRDVRDFILKLKEMGKTVFLSSHLLYEVSEVADRIAIISHGRIVACDTLDNLESQAQRSTIHMEILPTEYQEHQESKEIISRLYRILHEFIEPNTISYHGETHVYQIDFNGNPQTQHQMLKTLLANDIPVVEFSVPKAGLLEALYLDIIAKSDTDDLEHQKANIKVEAVL